MVKKLAHERRQWIRAKRVLSIEFQLKKSKHKIRDKENHISTTRDMGIGGLAFYTEREYRKGDVLDIHVTMSGLLDIFNGDAKVTRVEKKRGAAHYLVAVQFLQKPKKIRSARSHLSVKKKPARNAKRI